MAAPTFRAHRLAVIAAVCLLTLGGSIASGRASTVSDNLRSMVDDLRINRQLSIGGEQIAANRVLIDLYARTRYQPLWQNESTVQQLITQIMTSDLDGLNPDEYHLETIAHQNIGMENDIHSPQNQAKRDLILSDALIRLASHLYFGKVDPRSQNRRWPLPPYIGNHAAANIIATRIKAGQIDSFLKRLRPHNPVYQRLVHALADYRKLEDAGGWPEIPPGPLIEKGDHDPRVPLIRQRLLCTGDLPPTSVDSGDGFNQELEDATCLFQDRHLIDTFAPGIDDRYGAVGSETREQMNLSVKHRINQIRVNLERARWVMHQLPSRYLFADIANFSVVLVDGDQVIWRSRAQVGDAYRKTPVFQSRIKYMEINPTWTIPPGRLEATLLPELRKNPHSKRLERYVVYERDGKPVENPTSIPWGRYTGTTLPYRLVQRPGPDNPMGRIKFIFPNPDFVFIHDTPNRAFFDLGRRDLSAGCIRIEKPVELAGILMGLDGLSEDDRIQTLLNSGRTGRIYLNDPFPVILFYGTVSVSAEGIVTFRPDVYDRDPKLLDALDASADLWGKSAY